MQNKIAAVIVSYNPEESLIKLILSLEKIKQIIVVDNNSKSKDILNKLKKLKINNLIILELNKNLGIAGALNLSIKKLEQNIKYFFTFDQDSEIDAKYLDIMIQEIDSSISILCPRIYDLNLGKETKNLREYSKNKKVCIQSGMLINKMKFNKTLGFEEKLFMYYVDDDICYKISEYGEIKESKNAILKHRDGELQKKNFFSKEFSFNKRTELAVFYRARNCIYMIKKYDKKYLKDLVYDFIINILCFKLNKKFILNFLLGLKDGIKNF